MQTYVFKKRPSDSLPRYALTALLLAGAATSNAAQIELDNLTVDDGFVAQGTITSAYAGASVRSAGDMNDDFNDTPDLIINEPLSNRIHVVYDYNGATASSFPLSQSSQNSFPGFTVTDVHTGYDDDETAFTALGDIDGDGYDDIVIGGNTGLNFIFGGPALPATFSINSPIANIVRVDTTNNYGPFTSIDDLRIGPNGDRAILLSNKSGTNSGNSYVLNVEGLNPNSSVNLGSLSGSTTPQGFSINRSGIAANLGDIDADGVEELALAGGIGSQAAMVFNADANYDDVDINKLTSNGGFFIFANDPITSITGIGDIDNDSVVDFAVGINSTNPVGDRAYVVYGKGPNSSSPFGNVFNLAGLSNPSYPYSANLEGFGVKCYCSVGAARSFVADTVANGQGADVDGDGLSDLVLGLNDQSETPATSMNDTYVLYGRFSRSSFNYLPDLSNANGIWASRIKGKTENDDGARNVAVLHDPANPDTIIIGARKTQYNDAGAAYVIYGKPRPW